MKNTIRCCISCILPCGALDVIRIVHTNGRVEEISGSIKASEIMKLHPKHVLKKPSSSSLNSTSSEDQGCCPKIVVVPPDAELQRGKIYFLMPLPPSAPQKKSQKSSSSSSRSRSSSSSSSSRRKKREVTADDQNNGILRNDNNSNNNSVENVLISDRYLSEILSEKISTQRDRRRGRAGIWRPHLESICETPSEA